MMGMNFDGIVSSDADDGLILPKAKITIDIYA